MIYLKYLKPYHRVFFFHKRDDITDGDSSPNAYNSETRARMTQMFGLNIDYFKDGEIHTLDYRIQVTNGTN